jgi:hypothetical protein
MRSRLQRWRESFSLAFDAFAIGQAIDMEAITPAQASNAIARAVHRHEVSQLGSQHAMTDSAVARREGELVDAG